MGKSEILEKKLTIKMQTAVNSKLGGYGQGIWRIVMIWTPPERQEAAASKEGTGPIPQIFTIQKKLPSASTCTSAQV